MRGKENIILALSRAKSKLMRKNNLKRGFIKNTFKHPKDVLSERQVIYIAGMFIQIGIRHIGVNFFRVILHWLMAVLLNVFILIT